MTSTDILLDTTDRAIIGRAHHVVDIENLLGLTRAMSIDPATGRLYRGLVQAGDHDLFTVAADVNRWPDTKFAFGGAHVVAGYGRDGADRALDAAVDLDHIARRFDTLVIASGDHWFTDMAYRAGRLGLHVVVVSRPEALSAMLRPWADAVVTVPKVTDGRLPDGFTEAA